MKWFNIFKKKEKEQETGEPPSIASIALKLDTTGDILFECEWLENDQLTADIYSEMIYRLTEGYFSANIAEVLLSHGKECEEDTIFIAKLLSQWEHLVKTKLDSPIVKPSEVFKGL